MTAPTRASLVGLCECGCGERTTIARDNEPKRGYVKGQPRRYIKGHARRVAVAAERAESFLARVVVTDSCWEWVGAKNSHGYGTIQVNRRRLAAHRWSYEHHVGPIPDGLVIDHLCRNTLCVNPDHLEPVTNAENLRRGLGGRLRTHCPQGHEYTPENTRMSRGYRTCRTCYNARQRAYRAARKAAAATQEDA